MQGSYVISPGAPIPLLTGHGQIGHQLLVNALERQGMIYRIAFSSPDPQARIEATEAGLGLTSLPRDQIPPTLMEAREYYLPPLPPVKLYLCRRAGSDIDHERLIAALKEEIFGNYPDTIHKLAG